VFRLALDWLFVEVRGDERRPTNYRYYLTVPTLGKHGYDRLHARAVCKLPGYARSRLSTRPVDVRDSMPTSHVPDSSHVEYPNPDSTHMLTHETKTAPSFPPPSCRQRDAPQTLLGAPHPWP